MGYDYPPAGRTERSNRTRHYPPNVEATLQWSGHIKIGRNTKTSISVSGLWQTCAYKWLWSYSWAYTDLNSNDITLRSSTTVPQPQKQTGNHDRQIGDSGKHRFHELEYESKTRHLKLHSHTSNLPGSTPSEAMSKHKQLRSEWQIICIVRDPGRHHTRSMVGLGTLIVETGTVGGTPTIKCLTHILS